MWSRICRATVFSSSAFSCEATRSCLGHSEEPAEPERLLDEREGGIERALPLRAGRRQLRRVFAPAAFGAVLNDATIPRLRCRIVCGGANNQLPEARHDAALPERGIVFVPDYLANAGGIIDFHQKTIDDQPDAVMASVARIGFITRDVPRCYTTSLSVADRIVRGRIRR